MPGRIITALKQAKSMNPVMLLDEIDKMGSDFKGDPSSAMLETYFRPRASATERPIEVLPTPGGPYRHIICPFILEVPVDLSDVLFITTANSLDTIPAPLRDRMEIIELSSYTREEKFNIAKRHLLPRYFR